MDSEVFLFIIGQRAKRITLKQLNLFIQTLNTLRILNQERIYAIVSKSTTPIIISTLFTYVINSVEAREAECVDKYSVLMCKDFFWGGRSFWLLMIWLV